MLLSLMMVGAAAYVASELYALTLPASPGTEPPRTPTGEAEEEIRDSSPNEATDPDDDDEASYINRGLALSSGALALQVGGALLSPLFSTLSIVPLTFAIVPFIRRSYKNAEGPDQLWVAALDTVSLGGTLATGHWFACALGGTLVFSSFKAVERSRHEVQDELGEIFGELPSTVRVLREGVEVEISVRELLSGESVIVYPGTIVPVDGLLIEGGGAVDERALTGEAVPAYKEVGDRVFASTLAVEGPFVVCAERTGDDTTVGQLHGILRRTDDATNHYRSRGELVFEKGAAPTVMFSAATWLLRGTDSALAVSYGGAGGQMRLAAPLSALTFIRLAARRSVLVKDARALEILGQVDTVLFDKTGTLTHDVPDLIAVHPARGVEPSTVLRLAASVEHGQEHPLARAIIGAAEAEGLELSPAERTEVRLGSGLSATVEGQSVKVGSAKLMLREQIPLGQWPAPDRPEVTAVYVAVDGQPIGRLDLAARARAEAHDIVTQLQARGLHVALVSGDRREVSESLARQLGVDEVHAEVRPEQKSAIVEGLQARGRRVCFVGDGINDAIALKTADTSISLAGASAAATDTAAIVMLDGDLSRLPMLFELADRFALNIRRSAMLTLTPGVVCISGVYLFNMSVTAAVMLYNTTLALAIGNAIIPSIDGSSDEHPILSRPVSSQ